MPEFLSTKLISLRDDFLSLPRSERLTLLLELANELPDLPEKYANHPELLERVEECQSPVYLFVDVDEHQRVWVYATAPREAPTTRGFASILVQGLSGEHAEDILETPDDFPGTLGLNELISPLRVRGMSGMLWRIKRQIRSKLSEASGE